MKYILLLIISFISLHVSSNTIKGYVIDSKTGESLIGAHVFSSTRRRVSSTNKFGYFVIPSDSIKTTLSFSYIGYKSCDVPIFNNDTLIFIRLTKDNTLQEVEISAENIDNRKNEMSVVNLTMRQVMMMPALGGEVDLIKTMQLMPGIAPATEGQSTMNVRGGDHNQNLLLLDDVPIYNINHIGGFTSIFNPDAINNIKMYKGAFPARYDGRLSSVMDVRMKDGNTQKKAHSVTLGLLTWKAQTEGPIKKDTSSYLLSARRFMYDLFQRPYTWISNNRHSEGYTFFDLNGKVNYKLDIKNTLFLSFYAGRDKQISRLNSQEFEAEEKSTWGNNLTSFRWSHIYGPKLFSNTIVYNTNYFSNSSSNTTQILEQAGKIESSLNTASSINDLCIKNDFEYNLSKCVLRFGSNSVYHRFTPQKTNSSTDDRYFIWENSLYVENDFHIGDYFGGNIGVRGNMYTIEQTQNVKLLPRIVLNTNIPNLFFIKASYSEMQQLSHALPYQSLGMSGEVWLPSTKNIPPEHSKIVVAGISRSIFNNDYQASVEYYFKKMSNLIEYKEGSSPIESISENWQSVIEKDGTGNAKGIEFLLQKKEGKLDGWIGYTLSRSTRKFENINDGKEYLNTYDATHDFSIVLNYNWSENFYWSATWVYLTGRAVTFANEKVASAYIVPLSSPSIGAVPPEQPKYDQEAYYSYSSKNNIRYPAYHRLDIGLNYEIVKSENIQIWNFGIYNVYNRKNIYTIRYGSDSSSINTQDDQIYGRTQFPFLPYISWTIKF